MDGGGGEDLGEGVDGLELGVGVALGVFVVYAAYFGEVGGGGAVSFSGGWVVSLLVGSVI